MRRHTPRFSLLAAAVLAIGLANLNCTSSTRQGPVPMPDDRGAALFARHCAACHGRTGSADTPAASLLLPRPRAFSDGVFKLASTTNGVPSDADLVAMLRRGMPGSTMMSWGWMPEQDLALLASHVRELAMAGRTDSILGHRPADAATTARARAEAERELTPGPALAVPPQATADDATMARGRDVYLRHCAACHGDAGEGLRPAADWAGAREMLWPRDFTAGFLRGEATHDALAHRILGGMPGAHMPPARLSAAELQAVVAWVQALLPDGAATRHSQWRRHLRVARTEALPESAQDPRWQQFDAVRLPLAPLRWRPDAVFEVRARFAHDARRLVVHLEWDDDTRDDRMLGDSPASDGAAIQFSSAQDAPLFAMGSTGEPVELWYWKSFREQDVAGALDLLTGALQPTTDAAVPIPGITGPGTRGEALVVHGFESMARARGTGIPLRAVPSWHEGTWSLVLARDLAPAGKDAIDFRTDGGVLFSVAVWDGSIDLQPWSKSITTWHRLELDD